MTPALHDEIEMIHCAIGDVAAACEMIENGERFPSGAPVIGVLNDLRVDTIEIGKLVTGIEHREGVPGALAGARASLADMSSRIVHLREFAIDDQRAHEIFATSRPSRRTHLTIN